ncbi:MAG TPA: hypothetical protein VJI33_00750 [Candidatus Paceibacterota bacterium]
MRNLNVWKINTPKIKIAPEKMALFDHSVFKKAPSQKLAAFCKFKISGEFLSIDFKDTKKAPAPVKANNPKISRVIGFKIFFK